MKRKRWLIGLLATVLTLSGLVMSAAAETYVVQKGDSLWKIAARKLGSGLRWVEIYEANKDQIGDINLLHIGQVLNLPVPEPEPSPEPSPEPPVETSGMEIAWNNTAVGEISGELKLDEDTMTWTLECESSEGVYTLSGWYLDNGAVGLTSNGGMGAQLDVSSLKAVLVPAMKALLKLEFSTEITWEDPLAGTVTGMLTVYPEEEEWELNYNSPFGSHCLQGWYSGEGETMGLTNDDGIGRLLDNDILADAVLPAIQRLLEDR